ncbi:hypothetical protein CRENBAI_008754, partial [Crenichthys baileyi]
AGSFTTDRSFEQWRFQTRFTRVVRYRGQDQFYRGTGPCWQRSRITHAFGVEGFSPPSSPEVKGGFMEPNGPEPQQLKPPAQDADSAKPEAGAAEAVEDGMGPVSE